jgi:cold shock protein
MPVGTVKFFNTDKGYGFIAPDGGGADSFVHISAVERAGMSTLDKELRYGMVAVTGSFALPNGDRISTVRKDVMDRALGRNHEHADG